MKKLFVVILITAFAFVASPGYSTDFDFSGNFSKDNDVVMINFSVAGPSTVTVFSSSWLYANPPTDAGPGGFDPMLGIWTGSGALINFQDDGGNVGSTLSNGISYDHGTWDSYYVVTLAAGSYIATVTEFDNFPKNGALSTLSDGFTREAVPNFTFTLGYGGATQPYFNGVWDNNDPRTSYWQFHLLGVDTAAVVTTTPEPATMLLLGLGLVGLAGIRRKS